MKTRLARTLGFVALTFATFVITLASTAVGAAANDVRAQYNLAFHFDTSPFACGSESAARAYISHKTFAIKGSPLYSLPYFKEGSDPARYACVADLTKAGWVEDDSGFVVFPVTVVATL